MRFARLSLIVVVASTLTACISPRVAPEKQASVKRIAVVSLVQNALDERDVSGFLEIFNSFPDYKLPEWRLQQRAEDRAAAWLADQGYEVVRVTYPAEEIWSTYHEPFRHFVTSPPDDISNLVVPHVGEQDIDAVVVIHPGQQGERCRGGEVCFGYGDNGFGIYVEPSFLSADKPHVYASIAALVIDVPSGDILARVEFNEVVYLRRDFKILPDFEGYTMEDRQAIRERVDRLLDDSVETVLTDVGL